MNWTAEKIYKEYRNGLFRIGVRYTHRDGNVIKETIRTSSPDNDGIDRQIRQRLSILNSDVLDTIALGAPREKTEPQPAPIPEPSQEEIDRKTFFEHYEKLQTMKQLQSVGVEVDSAALASLENSVKEHYRPEYFGLQ